MTDSNTIKQLINDLNSSDEEIQKTAAKACFNIFDSALIPHLKKLSSNKSTGVRYFAKKSLFNIINELKKTDNSTESSSTQNFIILNMLEDSEDQNKILKAIRIIKIKNSISEDILNKILTIAKTTKNNFILANLISVFSIHKYEKAYNFLLNNLKHSDLRVKANTIESLRFFNTSQTIICVTPFLKDNDNRIKANTIKLLHDFSVTGIEKDIKNMLFSDKEWEKDSALYVIMTIGPENFKQLLSDFLNKEKITHLRKKAMFLLKKCN